MPNTRASILVVEDDPVQQNVMRILCKRFGFRAVIVSSGEEALAQIISRQVRFKAVLMDWKLTDMDGLACTRAIRAWEKSQQYRTPIIACTAKALQGDREQCIAAGMDDYLSKPFTLAQLQEVLSRCSM